MATGENMTLYPPRFPIGSLVEIIIGLNGSPAFGKIEKYYHDGTYLVRMGKLGVLYYHNQLRLLTPEESMVMLLEQ